MTSGCCRVRAARRGALTPRVLPRISPLGRPEVPTCLRLLLHVAAEDFCTAIFGIGDEVVILVLEPVLAAKRQNHPLDYHARADSSAFVNIPGAVNWREDIHA